MDTEKFRVPTGIRMQIWGLFCTFLPLLVDPYFQMYQAKDQSDGICIWLDSRPVAQVFHSF